MVIQDRFSELSFRINMEGKGLLGDKNGSRGAPLRIILQDNLFRIKMDGRGLLKNNNDIEEPLSGVSFRIGCQDENKNKEPWRKAMA
jgi:hypothetical protein